MPSVTDAAIDDLRRIGYRVLSEKQIEICEVWAVGDRADAEVYAETAARVQAASGRRPEISASSPTSSIASAS